MEHPISPSWLDMARQERILTLAKHLTRNQDAIDLGEVDGEFYWRICRSDLLDDLARLAQSIAPQVLGGAATDRLDARSRRLLELVAEVAREDPASDDAATQGLLDMLRDVSQQHIFVCAAGDDLKQVPRFVWERFATGRPIPMRAPLRMGLTAGGSVLEVGVFSGDCSGGELEAFVAPPDGYKAALERDFSVPSVPYPPYEEFVFEDLDPEDFDSPEGGDAADARTAGPEPADAEDLTETSLHIDFALVKELPLPASSRLEVSPGELPFVLVRLPLPLPPNGVIAPAYTGIVRVRHQWHRELGESKQQNHVAIRTWAVGLLMASGMREIHALFSVAEATEREVVSHPCFNEDRETLVVRVPEAEPYVYVRGRRAKPPSNP